MKSGQFFRFREENPLLGSQEWIWESLGNRAVPNSKWVSSVLDCNQKIVNKTFEEIFSEPEIDFEEEIYGLLKLTQKTYYAQFPAPIELYTFVRLTNPEFVLESGVSSGISSSHILMALHRNKKGTLYSIDFPVRQKSKKRERGSLPWMLPFDKSSGWAVPPKLKKRWKLLIGKSEKVIPKLLSSLPRVDLFCHDSPASAMHLDFELKHVKGHLKAGSVVVADNTDMNSVAFHNTASSVGARIFYKGHSKSLAAFRVPSNNFL